MRGDCAHSVRSDPLSGGRDERLCRQPAGWRQGPCATLQLHPLPARSIRDRTTMSSTPPSERRRATVGMAPNHRVAASRSLSHLSEMRTRPVDKFDRGAERDSRRTNIRCRLHPTQAVDVEVAQQHHLVLSVAGSAGRSMQAFDPVNRIADQSSGVGDAENTRSAHWQTV